MSFEERITAAFKAALGVLYIGFFIVIATPLDILYKAFQAAREEFLRR